MPASQIHPVLGPYTYRRGFFATAAVDATAAGAVVDFAADFTSSGAEPAVIDLSDSEPLRLLRMINNDADASVAVELDGTGAAFVLPPGGVLDLQSFDVTIGITLKDATETAEVYLEAHWGPSA